MKKDLAHYRSLPYELTPNRFTDEDDGQVYYCYSYTQLPTVQGVHSDRLVALQLAKELFDSFIVAQLEWGEPIPEPEPRYRQAGGQRKFGEIRLNDVSPNSKGAPPARGYPDESTTTTGARTDARMQLAAG